MSTRSRALSDMANRLRIHSIESTSAAGSGHPTSCCSMAEITAVLFFDQMRYDIRDPRNLGNDRFILSKGHAAPILYAAWSEAGLIPAAELLNLRKLSSDLEGHPTPRLSFVDVATGSLGQGLSAGCGMAFVEKYVDAGPARFYVIIGDGESAEGSVWEAMAFASHHRLDNLVAIFDVNRLGQSDPTMDQHHMEVYLARVKAFGWHAILVNGHDVDALVQAFDEAARTKDQPTAIVARTFKGHGIPGIEDKEHWHGKALGDKTAAAVAHLKSLLSGANSLSPKRPAASRPHPDAKPALLSPPSYQKGAKVATRLAFGEALVRLGKIDPRVVALDGDVKNSTYSDKFHDAFPNRFLECYIAEQNMVGAAVGAATRGKIAFAATFGCFLSRAYDQVRMAAISQSTANFVGTHCGVSIGQDGPSQMALEDLAMFRAIPGAVVFYPSDAVATDRAVLLAANHPGLTYIRTGRPENPVFYGNEEPFEIGKAKVARSAPGDVAMVIGAGVTFFEALAAADQLATQGSSICVIDPFTIKPIDAQTILREARRCGGRILTVEDHYPEGGVGEAVAAAIADETGITIRRLAVHEVPRSGKPDELLDKYQINAKAILRELKTAGWIN